MKKNSRFVCILLAVFVLASSFQLQIFAKDSSYPVVFVTGYSSCQLYLDKGTENEKKVWKPEIKDMVISALKENTVSFAFGIVSALLGDWNYLIQTVGPYISDTFEYMKMNDDGSSKYNVSVYPHSIEDTTLDVMKKNHTVPDHDSMTAVGKKIGDKNVYCCTMDWRKSQTDCAKELDSYIHEVLKKTGKTKVNLIGISFGGEVVSTYLYYYGGNQLNNVVLNVPAIGGTKVASQLLEGKNMDVNLETLLGFFEESEKTETDYQWLSKVFNIDFINKAVLKLVNLYAYEEMKNYGSLWDLVPLDDYDALKAKLLDSTKNSEIIEKSDKLHYDVMANLHETFSKLREQGINISLVVGTGSSLALGSEYNSDGVIDVTDSTGALCSELNGKLKSISFSGCTNKSHYHISPSYDIDASSAYLPENTWFVEGMMHGMSFSDKKVSSLIISLLTTDEIENIYSSEKYPQFLKSESITQCVSFSFEKSLDGFMTQYDNKIIFKNLSEKYPVSVLSVKCDGANLNFSFDKSVKINAGESLPINVYGVAPKDSGNVEITVEYVLYGEKIPTVQKRTLKFYFASGFTQSVVLKDDADLSSSIMPTEIKSESFVSMEIIFARILDSLKSILMK